MTYALQPPPPWPPNAFDEFWRLYPRRVAKKAAVQALRRVERSGEVAFASLLEAVDRYAESVAGKDPQYIAHPTTWLHQGRWEDDPAGLGGVQNGQRKISAAEGWAGRRMAETQSKKRPDKPRCLVASNTR